MKSKQQIKNKLKELQTEWTRSKSSTQDRRKINHEIKLLHWILGLNYQQETYLTPKKTREKKCLNCKNKFIAKMSISKFCCRHCRNSFVWKRDHTIIKNCLYCKTEFKTTRSSQKYCNVICRNKNHYLLIKKKNEMHKL